MNGLTKRNNFLEKFSGSLDGDILTIEKIREHRRPPPRLGGRGPNYSRQSDRVSAPSIPRNNPSLSPK